MLKHSAVDEWPSKNAHNLISGIGECATVYGKMGTADVIIVIDPTIRLL